MASGRARIVVGDDSELDTSVDPSLPVGRLLVLDRDPTSVTWAAPTELKRFARWTFPVDVSLALDAHGGTHVATRLWAEYSTQIVVVARTGDLAPATLAYPDGDDWLTAVTAPALAIDAAGNEHVFFGSSRDHGALRDWTR